MKRYLVIKIGGSLLPHAKIIIRVILESNRPALILPGGGIFADAVRKTETEGTIAHWMAIAGMEQYGWFLSGFGIETTVYPELINKPRVLLPYRYLQEVDPLPHTWDVTSDTISAWLADQIGAELLILKSIDQIRAIDIPLDQITRPVETPDLDPLFIPYILNHSLIGRIINGTIPDRIDRALRGEAVLGTSFGIMV
ncbi:MAG: uridylate kinase [Methanospirillum sp.]|uniref:uridylate kinase n=1 Tax=Methanospirillum sp. TaxID=45200 RepID=UPI00236ECAB6|nr:uridylate kinase [Methanospirillum sp.]MDD1728100.1 uridylate kinase [Methanospirillum sp.]